MKRKILLIIGCALMAAQAMAQSGNQKDVPARKSLTIGDEFIPKPIQPTGNDMEQLPFVHEESTPFLDTAKIRCLKLELPFLHDGERGIFPFHKKMFFYFEGEQRRYLHLAGYNLAYMALGWRFDNRFNLTGGLLAMKQFTNNLPYGIDRSGAKFNLTCSLTNQLEFNMWGQYLSSSSVNIPVDLMLPQTGSGASMVLNLGGGSQLGVGTEYRYDDKKEKWNCQSGGKLRLNF